MTLSLFLITGLRSARPRATPGPQSAELCIAASLIGASQPDLLHQAAKALDDRWLLPYRGLTVTRICVDYALTLSLGADAQVSIESTAILSNGPATAPLAPPITLEPQHQDVGPGAHAVRHPSALPRCLQERRAATRPRLAPPVRTPAP
jgi:hypothetical protein